MEMLLKGFLGTSADFMMDVVIVSLIIILPALVISRKKASTGDYKGHKKIQTSLFILLFIAVSLFEIDIRIAGGIDGISKNSRLYNTLILNTTVIIHLMFSVSTSVIWIVLFFFSYRRFPDPPAPNRFSRTHKFWGRTAMIDMFLTAITGVILYIEVFLI